MTNYKTLLTDSDRIVTRFEKRGKNILEFSVQYEALIDSRWRKVRRYDSSHDQPHFHVFSLGGEELYTQPFPYANLNEALTESQAVIKKTFEVLRESYLMTKRKDDV